MIKGKLKSFFNDIYNKKSHLVSAIITEEIKKFNIILNDKLLVKKFIDKFNFKPNPTKLYFGVVIKLIDNKTVKIVSRYLYKIKKVNLKVFRYKSFLIDYNIKNIDKGALCLFFFTNRKISKMKHACLYKVLL